ncbi:Cellulase [Thermaerobacter marianensis DSM 12885]|uniref:Cellulase n=1 Tax=Thermaerobacter marianensis (strain ATCC 700841 / DSM 12885 / JCM 10246 / 7p75a) TaxID=644966 RepID=E6SHK5_THEM7|nr:M42 family metallopeptidase [Thermaerobacter marianensis]ADU51800.1 Cellulase [Thermaerobacter marianensis DSM 12885]
MLLARLSEARGVSGDEAAVRELILEAVLPSIDAYRIDSMGNLLVVKGKNKSGPRVMVAAHMDEVGLMITRVEKNGLLRFAKVGGLDDRLLPGKRVRVGPDGVPGVIGSKPIHLDRRASSVTPSDELYIDIGATSREAAEKLVRPGHYATFDTAFGEFGQGCWKGKAFDDRVGCALLIELLRGDYDFPLYGAFTVQEEVGLRGAATAAYAIHPDVALVLEGTTCADIPGADEHGQSTRLGHGPAITAMDRTVIPPRWLTDRLVAAAERRGIPYQWKRTTFGGTDAGRIHQVRAGVPSAVVSVPCRYIHSPCAVMSRQDFENAQQLVRGFLEDLNEGGVPRHGDPS